ncbi:MAG: 3-hydroxybutyrate oligomer hydrolase family protein, partial [Gammaproteobacteria bacterium]|nr:3-hydroxybutyrate oligomer hydrolase family protein [Gammaproteobacteria bacterium]
VEAQAKINEAGILVEQNVVQPSHWWLSVPQAIAVTYGNAYSRSRVEMALCGFTFGATDGNNLGTVSGSGEPLPLNEIAEGVLFGTGNGIPPTGGINVIYDDAVNGPILDRRGASVSSNLIDESFDGALCLRNLFTGRDHLAGDKLRGRDRKAHRKLLKSIREIRAKGDLGGRPAIFVTGRADAIIPPNHASRAYYGLNQLVEGDESNLRYYEITNAQHLDALNALSGFDSRFVPLHHYFIQGLDLMFAHLKGELAELPPSQVVETVPRGDGAPQIEIDNVPPISDMPAKPITFSGSALHIP